MRAGKASGLAGKSRHLGLALLTLALVLFGAPALAASDVNVYGAWIRATAPGQDTATAGLIIYAKKNGTLEKAETDVAKRVEFHVMKQENGMMVMRQVPRIELPKGERVTLGSDTHLMLVGLKHPLRAGTRIDLFLRIHYGPHTIEGVKVVAKVIPLNVPTPGEADKGNKGMGGMDMGGGNMGRRDY